MGRIRTRLRRIGVRQAGTFLAIIALTGVVAVLTVMAASELGIDQPPAGAVAQPRMPQWMANKSAPTASR